MEVEDTWSSAMLSALCLTISHGERTKIYLFQIKQRRTHCCIYCTLHSLHTHLRHRFHKHTSSWQSAGIQRFWWEVYYVSLPSPGPRMPLVDMAGRGSQPPVRQARIYDDNDELLKTGYKSSVFLLFKCILIIRWVS